MSNILTLSAHDGRYFSAELAAILGDMNAAIIVQQLHYWIQLEKDVGVIIDGLKWVYNSFPEWVREQFKWLSTWQFRKSMQLLRDLGIVKVIRYRAKKYDQTNYYTIDYDRLREFVREKSSESIEMVEMCATTDRDVTNPPIEVRTTHNSYTKNTSTENLHRSNLPPDNKSLEREQSKKQNLTIEEEDQPSSNDNLSSNEDPWIDDNIKNTSSSQRRFKPKKKGSGDVTRRTSKVSKRPWRSPEEGVGARFMQNQITYG